MVRDNYCGSLDRWLDRCIPSLPSCGKPCSHGHKCTWLCLLEFCVASTIRITRQHSLISRQALRKPGVRLLQS